MQEIPNSMLSTDQSMTVNFGVYQTAHTLIKSNIVMVKITLIDYAGGLRAAYVPL